MFTRVCCHTQIGHISSPNHPLLQLFPPIHSPPPPSPIPKPVLFRFPFSTFCDPAIEDVIGCAPLSSRSSEGMLSPCEPGCLPRGGECEGTESEPSHSAIHREIEILRRIPGQHASAPVPGPFYLHRAPDSLCSSMLCSRPTCRQRPRCSVLSPAS